MSLNAGELVVRIVGDAKGLAPALEKEVNGAAQGAIAKSQKSLATIGKQARDVGAKMSVAATLPLVALAKVAVDAASSTVEATNKVNVVFGKSADEVLRFGDTSAKAFGISNREALTAAGTFGNLFRAMGVGGKQAAATSVKMTGLAGDLASFNDADPSEVLEALRAGLIGEAEPLRRFGVQLSEARVEAEAYALGLVKPVKNQAEITKANLAVEQSISKVTEAEKKYGKGSVEARTARNGVALAQQRLTKVMAGSKPVLTDAQKLQARQSVILKDTKLAQGDFQRSLSSSAANQARVTKALADDSQAAIGKQLLPLYQKGIIKAGQLAEAFGKLSPAQQKLVVVGGASVAALGPVVGLFGNIARAGGGVAKGFSAAAGATSKLVGQAKLVGQGYRDAQAAQSAFSGGAGTLGGKLKTATSALKSGAATVVAQAKSYGQLALAYVRAGAAAAASVAKQAVLRGAALAQAAALTVLRGAQIAAAFATRVLSTAMAFLAANPIVLVIAALVALAVGLVLLYKRSETFRNIVNAVFGAVASVVSTVVGAVIGFLRKLGGFLVGAAVAYVRAYVAVWRAIFTAVVFVARALWAGVKAVFSKGAAVVRAVVNAVKTAVVAGFRAYAAVATAIVRTLWAVVSGAFQRGRAIIAAVVGAIKAVVSAGFRAVVSVVSSSVGKFISLVSGIKGKVVSALRGAATWLLDAGRNVIAGLVTGVTNAAHLIYDKIAQIAAAVRDKFASVLKIFSPSRVFSALGKYIVDGLALGLTKNAKSAVEASRKLAIQVRDAYAKEAKAGRLSASEKIGARRTLALIARQRAGQVALARRHDLLVTALATAKKSLGDLQKQAADYSTEVANALVDSAKITEALPEGVAVTTQSLTERLANQVAQAAAFGRAVQQLVAKGLDKSLIAQVVGAGADAGLTTAQELAGATAEDIAKINSLQKSLLGQAKALGTTASDALYQAGITGATALVGQLQKDEGKLRAVMVRQANVFAATVRKLLGTLTIVQNTPKAKPKGKTKKSGRRAAGGPVQPFRTYSVGETGPELLQMGSERGVVKRLTAGAERITISETHSTTNNINTVVNNPAPEPASESVPKRLRRLQQTGALE